LPPLSAVLSLNHINSRDESEAMAPLIHRKIVLNRPVAVTVGTAANNADHPPCRSSELLFTVVGHSIIVDTITDGTVINFEEISAFNVICVGHQLFLIVGQTDGLLIQVEVAASSSGAVSQSGRRCLTQLASSVTFVSSEIDLGTSKFVFVADVSGLWQLIDVMGSGDSEAPPSIVTVDTGACQCTA
jgi:hypothetical protein